MNLWTPAYHAGGGTQKKHAIPGMECGLKMNAVSEGGGDKKFSIFRAISASDAKYAE